ncbi:hypothetical protein, partial [Bradyrhizobium sp. 30]|uniref:hypothetical protein n=1 Tax=Bradyrhizobium sp. 30 TaxID=2782669 RepID=UPI001FF6FCEE
MSEAIPGTARITIPGYRFAQPGYKPCIARRATPKLSVNARRENIPLYRNSETTYVSPQPAQGRGAYRDRHERGPDSGGRWATPARMVSQGG